MSKVLYLPAPQGHICEAASKKESQVGHRWICAESQGLCLLLFLSHQLSRLVQTTSPLLLLLLLTSCTVSSATQTNLFSSLAIRSDHASPLFCVWLMCSRVCVCINQRVWLRSAMPAFDSCVGSGKIYFFHRSSCYCLKDAIKTSWHYR